MNLSGDEWIGIGIAATGVGVWLLLGVVSYALATTRRLAGSGGSSGWAERLAREPVRVRTAILAVFAVAASFGLPVSDLQQGLIVAAALGLLGLFSESTRSVVTPVSNPSVPKGTTVKRYEV